MDSKNIETPSGAKAPAQTIVIMTELILPSMANLRNNLQGGQMMHYMDIAGALTCRRHAGSEVATVTVDKIDFKHPVKVGEVITITSKMIWAGRTSMKVKIDVVSENLSGTSRLTNTAFFTYVALNDQGRPLAIPRLVPETQEEQEAFCIEQQAYEAFKKNSI